MQTDTPRTIEEAYESACSASNLKVLSEGCTDADVLIAAGWSDTSLGMALMRLQSEWAGSEKPQRVSEDAIKRMAATQGGGPTSGLTVTQAREVVAHWYANELSLLLLKLKSLKDVRKQMSIRADRKGINPNRVGAVILWWLDQTCHACDGHGKSKIPGAPSLSHRNCHKCNGTGKAKLPEGDAGRYLANLMDACVGSGRASLRNRLSATRGS